MKKRINRANLCSCGSKLKFKNCCRHKKAVPQHRHFSQNNTTSITPLRVAPFSHHFSLLPSVEMNGYRLRFIFNTIWYHARHETFHNFLFRVIDTTLGKNWYNSQKGMDPKNQHQVYKWLVSVRELQRDHINRFLTETTPHGILFSVDMDGPNQAILSFGWDLYCLQAKGKLPLTVQKKLIKNEEFQSSRYEVAVAAIMIRAGYKIEWYDIASNKKPRSEFIAIHSQTGQKITVEAKSLYREGSLHTKGTIDPSDNKVRQIAQRVRDAEKKKEPGIPHIIFIDTNRPPDPKRTESDLDYLKSIIDKMPRLSTVDPAKHEALILTNFVPYYGGLGQPVPKYQHFPIFPIHSLDQQDLSFYSDIFNSLDHYSFIPENI